MKLFEFDARADFKNLGAGTRGAKQLTSWLKKNQIPLEEIPGNIQCTVRERATVLFEAEKIFNDVNFSNLMVGFSKRNQNDKTVQGQCGQIRYDGVSFYYIVFLIDSNPQTTTIKNLPEASLVIHEFTHYFDKMRSKTQLYNIKAGKREKNLQQRIDREQKRTSTVQGYNNSPLETNAYYMQGLRQVMDDLIDIRRSEPQMIDHILADYPTFRSFFIENFDAAWREALKQKNQRAFEKRLAGLYSYLRTKLIR